MKNLMNNHKSAVVITSGLLVLTLGGCWGGSPAADQQSSAPSSDTTPSCMVSCQDVPQAEQSGPPSLAADAEEEKAAVAAAQKVMATYADASKSKEDWFQALAPLIATAYAHDAQYIQPNRLPVRRVTSAASVVPADIPDGHQVRVKFGTNAGEWVVIMTRASAGAPWLASNVLPLEAS